MNVVNEGNKLQELFEEFYSTLCNINDDKVRVKFLEKIFNNDEISIIERYLWLKGFWSKELYGKVDKDKWDSDYNWEWDCDIEVVRYGGYYKGVGYDNNDEDIESFNITFYTRGGFKIIDSGELVNVLKRDNMYSFIEELSGCCENHEILDLLWDKYILKVEYIKELLWDEYVMCCNVLGIIVSNNIEDYIEDYDDMEDDME